MQFNNNTLAPHPNENRSRQPAFVPAPRRKQRYLTPAPAEGLSALRYGRSLERYCHLAALPLCD